MARFSDILYGEIEVPDWLVPFLRIPEFVRLRGVRLSNVDSVQFKDFNGPTRWEHSIAVAALADRCARKRHLSEKDRAQLVLAALLHDVATPPFAHTLEYILDDFDHEVESQRVLEGKVNGSDLSFAVFGSELPQFRSVCRKLAKSEGVDVDPDEVASMVVGQGDLGFLICGSLDLDNADNVTRASLHMGLPVDRGVPLAVADWLADQERPPADLDLVSHEAVQKWIEYRRELYLKFFMSSEEEIGRQAFLQHLIRRGLSSGLPRQSVIWQTDESLLALLGRVDRQPVDFNWPSLRELVNRYRLLEPAYLLMDIPVDDEEALRVLRVPRAALWMEARFSSSSLEAFVVVQARRHGGESAQRSLFPPPVGSVCVFKLGQGLTRNQLPEWLKQKVAKDVRGKELMRLVDDLARQEVKAWITTKPWLNFDEGRKEAVVTSLESVGNWSFHLSRNETLHPYPSTFVHAIPAALIRCLGLRGELIVDSFGGTGQTALEAIRFGSQAISADSNSIAVMIAKANLTYLPFRSRQMLSGINEKQLWFADPVAPPELKNLDRWFHPDTLEELCHVKGYIQREMTGGEQLFAEVAFSSILPQCTARRGKEHAYFADNTPLPRSMSSPPRREALPMFIERLRRNLMIVEKLYATLEREGKSAEEELGRVRVLQLDARTASPGDYGVGPGEVAGIITSPPYLCTTDYTLGQRLSYAWLLPSDLSGDFEKEVGPRRGRFAPERAVQRYFSDLQAFAESSRALLRKDGFLAIVLGAPTAKCFAEVNVMERFDRLVESVGFRRVWYQWRPINWQRNHGLQQVKEERLSVYVAE